MFMVFVVYAVGMTVYLLFRWVTGRGFHEDE